MRFVWIGNTGNSSGLYCKYLLRRIDLLKRIVLWSMVFSHKHTHIDTHTHTHTNTHTHTHIHTHIYTNTNTHTHNILSNISNNSYFHFKIELNI